jgi:hypothetical protein
VQEEDLPWLQVGAVAANVMWYTVVSVLTHINHWPGEQSSRALICFVAVSVAGTALFVKVAGQKMRQKVIHRGFENADEWILENGLPSPTQNAHALPLIFNANERFAATV